MVLIYLTGTSGHVPLFIPLTFHTDPFWFILATYQRGISNLLRLFIPLADVWMVIDNSSSPLSIVAEGSAGGQTNIHRKEIWEILNKEHHGK